MKKHVHTVKLMTLTELDNLVSMIKSTETRTSKTVLINSTPYDVERRYDRDLKIWGWTIWSRHFVSTADIQSVVLSNKSIGFSTTINKDI